MKSTKLFSLLFILILQSCVGTIEESPSTVITTPAQSDKLNFNGIKQCYAISNDKIEVLFNPAKINFGSVNQDQLIYQVFINGSFDKASASGQASELLLDNDSFYHLIVKNLELSTSYKLTVRVTDPTTGQSDANVAICEAKTDDEHKPNFEGLLDVRAYPGVEGKTKALLTWNEATPGKSIFDGIYDRDYAIDKYIVYKGTSPEDMSFLAEVSATETSYVANSLVKSTDYYFKVNAIDVNGRTERNQIVRKVNLEEVSGIEFTGISSAETIHSTLGFSALNITWPEAVGEYSIYKVFVVPETDPDYGKPISNANDTKFLYRIIDEPLDTSLTIQGLSSNTKYDVAVVACLSYDDTVCETDPDPVGLDLFKSASTTPRLAAFGGITSFTQEPGILGLTQAKLSWNPPTNEGVCDKIQVKDIYNDGNDIPSCAVDSSGVCLDTVASGLKCNDIDVVVKNLETSNPPNAIKKYCFQAYITSDTRTQDASFLTTKCGELSFEKPVFQGNFLTCNVKSSTEIEVSWTNPDPIGIMQNFLLLHKEKEVTDPVDGVDWFTFGKANYESSGADYPAWDSETFSPDTFTYSVKNLAPSTEYTFMIKTVAKIGATDFRYDGNTVLKTCKTKSVELLFNDWNLITSVGPVVSSEDAQVAQSVNAVTGAGGNLTSITLGAGDVNHTNGNSIFAFKDFKFSTGETYLDYRNRLGITNPLDGYYLFRSEIDFPSDASLAINSIDENNPSWTMVANISANDLMDGGSDFQTNGFIHLVDTLDNTHPITDVSIGGLTPYRMGQRGKIVNYAVRAVLNGQYVRIEPTSGKNAVVTNIIPPANMISIHPWMKNKNFCSKKSLESDSENNYRCAYTGAGATEDPSDGEFYFEEKSITLVDRYRMGCKPTGAGTNVLPSETHFFGAIAPFIGDLANQCFINLTTNDQSRSGFSVYQNLTLIQQPYGIETKNSSGDIIYANAYSSGLRPGHYQYLHHNSHGPTDGKWYAHWYEVERADMTNLKYETSSVEGIYNHLLDFSPGNHKSHLVKLTSTGRGNTQQITKCGSVEISDDAASSFDSNGRAHNDYQTERPAGCSSTAKQIVIGLQRSSCSTFCGTYIAVLASSEKPRTLDTFINELYPALGGMFSSGSWMTTLTNVFSSYVSDEYFDRTFKHNQNLVVGDVGKAFRVAGSTNFGLTSSQSIGLCNSKYISLKKNGVYLPKNIRKRVISLKDAFLMDRKYGFLEVPMQSSNHFMINDQYLCNFNATDTNYDCSVAPSTSNIDTYTNSIADISLNFPYSGYNATDLTQPGQDFYTNASGASVAIDYPIGSDLGSMPKYAYFKKETGGDTDPFLNVHFLNPDKGSGYIYCALEIELDNNGNILKVDGKE